MGNENATRASVTKEAARVPAYALLGLPAEVLAALLPALADLDTCQSLNHVAAVAVDRVAAVAWNERRLEHCRRLLAAGEKAPPVHLSRYWLHGQALYTVSDGNHRTVAAREAGRQRIRARIGGECWCAPEQHWLEVAAGRLWREVQPGGRVLTLVMDDIWAEVAAAMLAVGVHGR